MTGRDTHAEISNHPTTVLNPNFRGTREDRNEVQMRAWRGRRNSEGPKEAQGANGAASFDVLSVSPSARMGAGQEQGQAPDGNP